ncbi:uncharacterized protein F4822DRAFT_424192 [Hypoxylon trugodes]|uniref:uncharacterized protein n=1 Tax=Hypoxylon trugodes TaxID=326681 RepID=UPI0021943D02|nr:uncharacterized protein F4822DRAFT_424192 [Hypoxylon trugodes]KAI1393729.1 hypothetical protein F4822DRAFT_424192 [Hypoxylon trugodes]
MDQDSRSSEPRERAVSSEPCSTRPNPFDDGDLSARKRRRTSLSGSRSASVDTLLSGDDAAASSESNIMKIDTPEPLPPSTPARSEPVAEPTTEPVSSKVTINLRNADSLEDTPSSPSSPTPSGFRKNPIKVSVEESEVYMTQATPIEDASSSESDLDSSEIPAVSQVDDVIFCGATPLLADERATLFSAVLLDFPYHSEGEQHHETVARLNEFFRQQPSHADEPLHLLHGWLCRYVMHATIEYYPIVMEAHRENKLFWQALPDLFLTVANRYGYSKTGPTREVVGVMFVQLAKITGFLLAIDCQTLMQAANKGSGDFDLISPGFLRLFSSIPNKEESQAASGLNLASNPKFSEALDELQASSDGFQAQLGRFTDLLMNNLLQSPKRVMDSLVGLSWLVDALMRDSFKKQSLPGSYSPDCLDRARKNMIYGLEYFMAISAAIDTVIEKSTNNLGSDTALNLINSLTSIFKHGLLGNNNEAIRLVQDHQQQHPELEDRFTHEAMPLEWRMNIFCKMVRSRQMQLRVSAATSLCEDLVMQWRSFADHHEVTDDNPHLIYLRYLSGYLLGTGIVDYLLGPTCHPEITQASFNIVGFLAVTKTYTTSQTDLLWQTLVSAQDPRISDAIVRMMSKVVSLLQLDCLFYMCEKFCDLPIDSFSSCMRDLFEHVTKQVQEKANYMFIPLPPYRTCLRLLRESSVYGSQGSVAYPEIHQFAAARFSALLHGGPDNVGRQIIWMDCVNDIAAKSPTTSGSLHALSTLMGTIPQLQTIITENNLTQLLIDELESTIADAKAVGFTPVYANPIGSARRRILSVIIANHGSTIGSELGQRLWDLLVGSGAACQDDRKAAWDDLNMALKRTRLDNPFLNACLREYLPTLPPSCYCGGALAFVREAIIPLANDINGMILDDEDSIKSSGLELLWHMILSAPPYTIEDTAISTLVHDIYVDSKSIISYPLHRARKVHFTLVQRCLGQLKFAAQKLKGFDDGTPAGDNLSAMIVIKDEQRQEQELQFIRSLQVLITLLKALQSRPHFAAPDLRSLMLQAPSPVDGDLADLKYQSFDGDDQTEVRTLDIGLKNTAASLLASLREATGFDNYRLYYRGQPLAPSEGAICKSIEDLDIRNGLILVKREIGVATSPKRIKPGASPLDIEILSHFKDLWEYLSMKEELAREIYLFLGSLPADDSILTAFENPATSYRDVFPLGQPFKSLYALHALREYLSTRRLKSNVMQLSLQDGEVQAEGENDQQEALAKAMSLIIAAICDSEVVERGASESLQLRLSLELIDNFVQLLKEIDDVEAVVGLLNLDLQERLSTILKGAAAAQTNQISIELINRSFEALLESCAKSDAFWKGFRDQTGVQKVVQSLLLDDARPIVRNNIARLITLKCLQDRDVSGAQALDFAELFWPIVFQLVPRAVKEPSKCEETFNLSFQLVQKLIDSNSDAVDLPACLRQCGQLLLSHTTTVDIAHPGKDVIAHGLITILSIGITEASSKERVQFGPNFVPRLFSKHLFPPEDEDGPLVPKVILHTPSRSMLYDIILALARDDMTLSTRLLHELDKLTDLRIEDGIDEYKYDLPQLFERSNAIRSSCGYSGLRNLSNTCYLNSLFTQLFMNIGFRRFMLERRVRNPMAHPLLHETQVLFAFLQDSRRRYVEPQACVGQIMTYDEAPIDIHNQMDVDEFYSLLFDRWEAQFSSETDKKKLRSMYGGELVQQVKSKECQHISERIEPFSAIQCDIKGKAGLEESLQAYVDGEIMEGDNKYKCSDCDRHVDAVKRACLKDIPDNLIFHLKRFDFNLRTLMRSKINDFFPFPTKIDMQPYTIEHISDPSRNAEPDIFELVGILVHSGTAESGHYYSYVRERPTTCSTPPWVEFNDEIVTSWDPSQMENACFGGADYRSQFEGGTTYEKVYSAYMLFYQRSSSLQKEQEELLKIPGQTGPFRASLPRALEAQIKEDNWSIVQRHCLYDPSHMPFAYEVLNNTWGQKCSKDHKKENLAMQTALGHLDQIASRAKDLPDFDRLKTLIIKVCHRCSMCCFSFFDYFRRHKDTLRMLLQKNSDAGVRQDIGRMLIYVLRVIKKEYPEEYGPSDIEDDAISRAIGRSYSVMDSTLDLFQNIWETFHSRINSWSECFGTMYDFAHLGRDEVLMCLERDYLFKLLSVIAVDQIFDLPAQYARLLNAVSRRTARPPNYESIIALVDELLSVIDPNMDRNFVDEAQSRTSLVLQGEPVPLTFQEGNFLFRDWAKNQANIFMEKLISLQQNFQATDSIIIRLIGSSRSLDQKAYNTLKICITGDLTSHMVMPFLRVAAVYCRYSTNTRNVQLLMEHISNQCKNLQNAEGRYFLDFQRETFDGPRNTGESIEMIHVHSLSLIPKWAPGLLGYIDHAVSDDVGFFLQDKLFKYGPSPAFGESDGGLQRSRMMNQTVKRLAISCLEYLKDTYVTRSAQAARYTVVPLDQVIKKCDVYFEFDEDVGDGGLEKRYADLRQNVMEPMARLTVDEIEEDGSDWEQSVGSSEQLDNLTDLSMQIDRDLA